MNLRDIDTKKTFKFFIKPDTDKIEIKKGMVRIELVNESGTYNLIQGDGSLVQVQSKETNEYKNRDFSRNLSRPCGHLEEITRVVQDGSAEIKVVFFGGLALPLNIEVCIDKKFEESARRLDFLFDDIDQLASQLHGAFQIKGGSQEQQFFCINSGAVDDIPDVDEEEASKLELSQDIQAFEIIGNRFSISVKSRKVESDELEKEFYATRIRSRKPNPKGSAMRLAEGAVRFSDEVEKVKTLAIATLELAIGQGGGSYLKSWDLYGNLEGEIFLKQLRRIGALNYTNYEAHKAGYKIFFDRPIPVDLSVGDSIEFTTENPIYLDDQEMTWIDFARSTSKNKEVSLKVDLFEIKERGKKHLVLAMETPPKDPKQGFFVVKSLVPDKAQIDRRMKARDLVLKAESANPQLGLIIEEGTSYRTEKSNTNLEPITPHVRKVIFGDDEVTYKQKRALDIALNTPDIALIQGPPGTGKTTLIAAILERLNEEHDKTKSVGGSVLVSAYQHDAVENVISRLNLNGLPTVKFGIRRGESIFTFDEISGKIDRWCQQLAKDIRQKNITLYKTEIQIGFDRLIEAYQKSPSKSNSRVLLSKICSFSRAILSDELIAEARHLLDELNFEEHVATNDSHSSIHALRVTEQGFADDGPQRCSDCLAKYEIYLNTEEISFLKELSAWSDGDGFGFLPKIQELKGTLLRAICSRPSYKIQKSDDRLIDLVRKVATCFSKQLSGKNQVEKILANFLYELENYPLETRDAIKEFNYAFAATVQQSAASKIREAKGIGHGNDELLQYDTVVIDEAARTSPRDLLIPLVQASNRIILVGDHRQLPHQIEEEICQQLESESEIDNLDYLQKSMFKYLWDRAAEIRSLDGIPRTVTLDKQFRSHPLLGKFISKHFYEKHDLSEAFDSDLDASKFHQSLEGIEGVPAVWIDVPFVRGKVTSSGYSKARECEAEEIAKRLNNWIHSEPGSQLSFGVISFYKGQIELIKEALSKYSITGLDDERRYQIEKAYQYVDGSTKERLRLGTVDAFQGREFDVVLLSVVRTEDMKHVEKLLNRTDEDSRERVKRRLFGFVSHENRLCVSMSRQKKSLVVVGDAEFIQSDISKECVPALSAFYKLCCEEGLVL